MKRLFSFILLIHLSIPLLSYETDQYTTFFYDINDSTEKLDVLVSKQEWADGILYGSPTINNDALMYIWEAIGLLAVVNERKNKVYSQNQKSTHKLIISLHLAHNKKPNK